jgi:exodeoxyribonuclease-3
VCLQEVRAQADQRPPEFTRLRRWHQHYSDAQKKGYSGVAILSRDEPDRVVSAIGYAPFDREGRYIQADFGDLSVVSIYLPSGSSSDERQAFKMRSLARVRQHMRALRDSGRQFVVCGDINIAHQKIDIENWRGNQKNSGFLPEERAWMDRLMGDEGWIDAFRIVDKRPKQYTWWSNRGQAWAKNVGWRIDYQLCTKGVGLRAKAAAIYKRRRFSDHAPLIIDYDFEPTAQGDTGSAQIAT